MSLLQEAQVQTSVFACNFECCIRQANIAMKFPCSYFVEWRTVNAKIAVKTQRHSPHQGTVIFDEKILMLVEMVYDHNKLEFLKRETIIELFLVSKSRPDVNKLVGRVNIDLGKVINVGMYEAPTEFKLNFCSIEGILIMQFKAVDKRLTTLAVQDLDKSSFIDFISQNALKNQTRNQSMILSRYQNQNADKRSVEKIGGRSQIRGISPSSPKQSNAKSMVNSFKAGKNEVERKVSFPYEDGREAEGKKNLFNDELSAHSQIISNSANLRIEGQILMQNDSAPFGFKTSPKNSQDISISRSYKYEESSPKFPDRKNRAEPSQKTSDIVIGNSVFISQTSKGRLINQINNEAAGNQLQSQNMILENKKDLHFIQSETEEFLSALQTENRQLKDEVTKLFTENTQLKFELQKSTKDLASRLQIQQTQRLKVDSQLVKKDRVILELQAQIAQRQQLIAGLQTQIKKIANFKPLSTESQSLKSQIASLQQIIEQLKQNLKLQVQKSTRNELQMSKYLSEIKSLQSQNTQSISKIQSYQTSQGQLINKLQQIELKYNQLTLALQSTTQQYESRIAEVESLRAKTESKISQSYENNQRQILQFESQTFRLQESLDLALERAEKAQKQLNFIQEKYFQLQTLYDQLKNKNNQGKEEQKSQILEEMILQNNSVVIEQIAENVQPKQIENQKILVQQKVEVINQIEQNEQKLADIKKIQQENQSLCNEIQFLKASLEAIERQSKNTIEALKNQNDSFKQQIISLQSKLTPLAQTNEKIAELIQQVSILTSQKNNLDQLIRKLNVENNNFNEKIENITKQLQKSDQIGKMLQLQNEQLREQIKAVQSQIELYQTQLVVLKNQIAKVKQSREIKDSSNQNNLQQKFTQYKEMISKLSLNLQDQINQNNQLSEAIVRYMEKEAKMKETLTVLESQSKQIFSLVQEKEQNEQTYQKAIEQMQGEILLLKNRHQDEPMSPMELSRRANESHNQELLKLQQKLLGQNNDLMLIITNLKDANSKLNDELMHLSLEHHQMKTKYQNEIVPQKSKQQRFNKYHNNNENILTNKLKQFEKSILDKNIQIGILKSKSQDKEAQQNNLQNQLNRLRSNLQQIQQEKFNLESDNNQKDIKIYQLQEELNALVTLSQIGPKQISSQTSNVSPLEFLSELREKLLVKNWNSDWDSLLQSVLDKSMIGEQTSRLLNLQEKSRLLSKELQRMKATLLKSDWRNHQQKIAAMGLFKKCEAIVTQLITCAQSLNQNQSSFL